MCCIEVPVCVVVAAVSVVPVCGVLSAATLGIEVAVCVVVAALSVVLVCVRDASLRYVA